MERFTISLSKSLAADFDTLIRSRGYFNRSEAVRDMLRRELEIERMAFPDALYGVANLSYVYNHHERRLSERLTEMQHDAHDLVVCSMHVHLDHDNCLETLMLRGAINAIRAFADRLSAEPGVRHSSLNLVPVDIESTTHHHHHGEDHDHAHTHCRPHT